MTGEYLKQVLEDVADNLFNPDPYYQQGGDMVRAGGLAYTIAVDKPIGQRISDMTLLKTGQKIDSAKKYVVSGWASINEGTEGPAVYDVVARHIQRIGTVRLQPNRQVKVVVADDAGFLPG
jgi:sulfur-oxidizing protein SoxB